MVEPQPPQARTPAPEPQPAAPAEPQPSKASVPSKLSKAERDQLVLDNLPLAHHIAARFRGRGPSFDDLVQVASAALVGAAARYDPDRCCDFVGFAVPTMTGEIKRYFRDCTWAVRVPRRLQELHLRLRDAAGALAQDLRRAPTPAELAAYLDVPIEDVRDGLEVGSVYSAVSLDAPRPESSDGATDLVGSTGRDDFGAVDWHEALVPALRNLPERDREIVYLRFFQEMTQEKIARRVGLSQMQVSRILRRILNELRSKLLDEPHAA